MAKQSITEKMTNIVITTITRDLTKSGLDKMKQTWKDFQEKSKVRKNSSATEDELEP